MAHDEARTRLEQALEVLLMRNAKVSATLRRERNPLGGDWEENAVILENDEVLEALDAEGRAQVSRLRAALARIAAGAYGTCAECGGAIAPARLDALPEITTCVDCARA